jgi:uncharacterized protein (DUF1697 family)
MPKLVAFLRAINVGGHTVTMEALRREFESIGLKGVETFIASGNVVFHAPSGRLTALERKIEGRLHESLGYEVATFIRTEAEVAAIARYKPFGDAQLRSAQTLNVAFLGQPLAPASLKSLMTLRTSIDDFHVNGREMYWLCRKKQSESTFSNVKFEKAVGSKATFRGVQTIVKLAAKYAWSSEAS